ncbi:hypothetical protein VN12_09425 [Pirellula sp. SH-Sr6A]|nr:hypothetical protein VN12_09425 [Pirellula sp. SH-Sr6A]
MAQAAVQVQELIPNRLDVVLGAPDALARPGCVATANVFNAW